MSYQRLNQIVRIVLAVTLIGAICLTVIAAKPGTRYYGSYPASVGTPAPVVAEWDVPAAFITVTEPAVISFPPEWNLADVVCLVWQADRGSTAPVTDFNDFEPQVRWDLPPSDAVVITPADIHGHSEESSALKIANDRISGLVSANLPYRVRWLGTESIPLYDNQATGGLMCYYFELDELGKPHIPFQHRLTFTVRNAHIQRNPAFYLDYNAAPDAKSPPQKFTLKKEDISGYLSRLVLEAPFAVRPMTAAQTAQQAAESGK